MPHYVEPWERGRALREGATEGPDLSGETVGGEWRRNVGRVVDVLIE